MTPEDEGAPIADAVPPNHLQILALDSGAPIAGAHVVSVAGAARSDREGLVALADLAGSGGGGPLADAEAEARARNDTRAIRWWRRASGRAATSPPSMA